MVKTVCVFCGSGVGANIDYSSNAEYLGLFLAERNIGLVYGGANVGLMRVIADTMLECGGEVTGVMPVALVEREVAHDNLTEMHIVSDMQERKSLMTKLSDVFIAMPGGYGTFDEIFEVLTWNQLGIIQKPIGLLNVNGYYNPLLEMLDKAVEEKFLRPEHRAALLVDEDVDQLWEKLNSYRPVTAQKWIEGLKAGEI